MKARSFADEQRACISVAMWNLKSGLEEIEKYRLGKISISDLVGTFDGIAGILVEEAARLEGLSGRTVTEGEESC